MINYELLRETYAIIGGIPQKAFDLNEIVTKKGKSLSCGTIACAMGWISMHPKFKELGLNYRIEVGLTFNGNRVFFGKAANLLFGVDRSIGQSLFGVPTYSELHSKQSHKKIFLIRLKSYLRKHGQLTSQLTSKKTC